MVHAVVYRSLSSRDKNIALTPRLSWAMKYAARNHFTNDVLVRCRIVSAVTLCW
jgi:hypothetical protein